MKSMQPPDRRDHDRADKRQVGSEVRDEAASLQARYGGLEPELVIELCVDRLFAEEIAVVSSFGSQSAVLLHMISEIDPTLPVQFLDTGKHFSATHDYRNSLIDLLGLKDICIVEPDPALLGAADPVGILFVQDADKCCGVRKVEPMARAIAPYRAWMTGRKRYQSETRAALPVFEAVGERVRINPLALWSAQDVDIYRHVHSLPDHPLTAKGYQSIGCQPCTRPVKDGGTDRDGRWAGLEKTECGIHMSGFSQAIEIATQKGSG